MRCGWAWRYAAWTGGCAQRHPATAAHSQVSSGSVGWRLRCWEGHPVSTAPHSCRKCTQHAAAAAGNSGHVANAADPCRATAARLLQGQLAVGPDGECQLGRYALLSSCRSQLQLLLHATACATPPAALAAERHVFQRSFGPLDCAASPSMNGRLLVRERVGH